MTASKTVVAFVLGIMLIGLALASVPTIVGARAEEEQSTEACPMAEITVDQGYGFSRVELRHACHRPA
jgi:hypothetical protein